MRLFKKKEKKCSKPSMTPIGEIMTSVTTSPTRKSSTASTASTTSPQSSISSQEKRCKFRYGTTEEASKYGYGDEMSWGEFGVGDVDTCPVQEDRKKILDRMSSTRQTNSRCDSVPGRQQSHRPTRRRSSIHFGDGNSSMGDSSYCADTCGIENTQKKCRDSKGSRQQRRRRCSITGAKPTMEQSTQYGEEEPWMTFGHSKPYSAEELLAEHNISLPNESTSDTDPANNKKEDVHTQSQQVSPQDMAKYDYGEAAPDSAAPTADIYGYGKAAPDSAAPTADIYGYVEAAPDSAAPTADIYGYGEAAPDSAAPDSAAPTADIYGYGEAAPDSAAPTADSYGYGEAAPDSHHQNDEKAIKQLYGYDDSFNPSAITTSSSRGARRRSTIQHIGKQELNEFDRKASRQSQRRQRRRRSSISGASSPKPRKQTTSTQYGEEAPWKVFGHAEPYSAEEYLAKFNVQMHDLPGSEELCRQFPSIEEDFRAYDTISIAN